MSQGQPPHHRFDRALRDAWRSSVVDVVEVVCGRPVPPGSEPLPARVEQGQLEVDGLVADQAGRLVHVEFQTRGDATLGWRMARYWAALARNPSVAAPDQHVVLLHPRADRPGIGTYAHGGLRLSFEVHRLWQTDPDVFLARPGLLRLVPLARAATTRSRLDLLVRAARSIGQQLDPPQSTEAIYWMAQLANLYLKEADVSAALERIHMPIDLSDADFVINARRSDIHRFAAKRFADEALAERVAAVPDELLDEALDMTATATAGELIAWLDSHQG